MFKGREKEYKQLVGEFSTKRKSAVLVYGKRRVGKSTLIKEAAQNFDGIVISHLFSRTSFEGNLSFLARSICSALSLPQMTFSNLFDIFDFLNAQNKKILLVFDEYQYLKETLKENEVDSFMQAIIDSLSENIKLVLCGSYISIIKELLQESNPLFGRFTLVMRVEEFDYLDAALFYPNLSVREKIRFYSVFGGSPYVLTNLNYEKSLEENIVNLLIDQNSLLRTYIENIMLKEIQKSFDIRILETLGNGKKRYSEILNVLNMKDSGLLDKQLKNLISMETIAKVFPINRSGDKKKQFYEIRDNLMRFFFSYIFANEALISKFGEEEFFKRTIAPSLDTFVSYRFEGIVNQYFSRLVKAGQLQNIEDFGSFWYDDAKSGKNGQFDCVLKESDGYDFFEVKFYERPMNLAECEKEETQIREIAELSCKKTGFVCSAGFDFTDGRYECITGEDIYGIARV